MTLQLHYHIENENREDLPWMILVNGLFAPLESWNESVGALTESFRVLRYDGPGQGQSPKFEDGNYSLHRLVSELESLMDNLGIQKAHFTGLSNGGRIALSLAQTNPERVLSVIAADTYSEVSELLSRKLNSWLRANEVGGPLHRFDVATPWVWGETIVNERPELLDFYRERAPLADNAVVKGLIMGAMEKVSIDLSQIKCPVIYVVGREDLLTPGFLHEAMAQQTPEAKLVVVDGGHASLLEYPQSLTTKVLPLLNEVLSRHGQKLRQMA